MIADPAQIAGLEMAYLHGHVRLEAAKVESRSDARILTAGMVVIVGGSPVSFITGNPSVLARLIQEGRIQ